MALYIELTVFWNAKIYHGEITRYDYSMSIKVIKKTRNLNAHMIVLFPRFRRKKTRIWYINPRKRKTAV